MSRQLVLSLAALFLFSLNADLPAQRSEPAGSRAAARPVTAVQPGDLQRVDPALITAAARTAKFSPKAITDPAGKKLTLTPAQVVSPRVRSLAGGRFLGTLDTQVQGPKTKLPPGKYNLFLVQRSGRWHLYFEAGGKVVGEATGVTVQNIDPKNKARLTRGSVDAATGAVTLHAERPLSQRGKPLLSPQEAIKVLEVRKGAADNAAAALEASLEYFISHAGKLIKEDIAKDLDVMSARLEELKAQKKRLAEQIQKQVDAQGRYERLRGRLRGAIRSADLEELKTIAGEVAAAAGEVRAAVIAFKQAASKAVADAKAVLADATRRAADEAARAAADAARKAADKVSGAVEQAVDAATRAAEEASEAAAQVADDAAEAAQDTAEAATDTGEDIVEAIVSFIF
jgi:hypothetical protein